jgi:hypothetical protein
VYLDCPSVSQHRFVMNFAYDIEYVSVFQNAKHFPSLQEAMQVFKCRSTITIVPGTIIHFNEQFSLTSTSLLISFTFDKESFSISLQNGLIVVTTSNEQVVSLALSQTITTSGIYIVFTEVSVQFHVTCPSSLNIINAAAFWNTTIFQSRVNIQTSRHHYIGNVATSVLLSSFCSTNNLITIIDSGVDCIKTDKIQNNIQIIDQANQVRCFFMKIAFIRNLKIIYHIKYHKKISRALNSFWCS